MAALRRLRYLIRTIIHTTTQIERQQNAAAGIVSGDEDLLVLSPFESVPVLRPTELVARESLTPMGCMTA